MGNQTNQTKTLKSIVEEILKNAEDDTINSCFLQVEGIEPYDDEFYYKWQDGTYIQLIQAGITAELADQYGGEGKGDKYWTVYKFSNGNEAVYVQFDGWYSSYNGSEFSEWFFVEPKEVQVVQYRRCN